MITTFEELPEIRERHRDNVIVLTGGVFDLIHVGHVTGMNFCRTFGDVLVVGVSSDERTRQRKGPNRPVIEQEHRLAMVDSLKVVDYTFIMPMPTTVDTPTISAIKMLAPDVYMDHEENEEKWTPYTQEVEVLGTRFEFNRSPRLDSTSGIIDRIIATSLNSLDRC